jgi:hypothetical protein
MIELKKQIELLRKLGQLELMFGRVSGVAS